MTLRGMRMVPSRWGAFAPAMDARIEFDRPLLRHAGRGFLSVARARAASSYGFDGFYVANPAFITGGTIFRLRNPAVRRRGCAVASRRRPRHPRHAAQRASRVAEPGWFMGRPCRRSGARSSRRLRPPACSTCRCGRSGTSGRSVSTRWWSRRRTTSVRIGRPSIPAELTM